MNERRSLSFYLFPGGGSFGRRCAFIAERAGGMTRAAAIEAADVAIAPRLLAKTDAETLFSPGLGTLVFHPSALPFGRGPDAIRWSVARGDRVSGATWFWADSGLDTGPVCEQEVVVLHPGETAGAAYARRFIPAGLRALERALRGVAEGRPRSIPQEEPLATYDGPYVTAAPEPPALGYQTLPDKMSADRESVRSTPLRRVQNGQNPVLVEQPPAVAERQSRFTKGTP